MEGRWLTYPGARVVRVLDDIASVRGYPASLLQLTARGKVKQQAVTAVARELLGFIWAIGVHVESQHEGQQANRKRAA